MIENKIDNKVHILVINDAEDKIFSIKIKLYREFLVFKMKLINIRITMNKK